MSAFGKQIGLGNLEPDSDGYCCLAVDEKLIVHVKYDADKESLIFLSKIGEMPAGYLNVYKKLLVVNGNSEETYNGVFAKAVDSNEITFAVQNPIDKLDYPRFEDTLKNFINTVEKWMQQLPELGRDFGDEDMDESSNESDLGDVGEMPFMRV
ncbi:MAG: hypothetical protein A2Y14_03070 [Verrucomicrobia bacterium GWF2_51_19]|nr:MAG: hypothetical protein A2Y14_03070 [Verrucomicrobia bacterium GWF2_51_19]